MNTEKRLHTTRTRDSNYTDHGSVRRLNANELANPQLRPDNKNLAKALAFDTTFTRPDNIQAQELMKNEYHTDYLNEAPVVREHNIQHLGGSFLNGNHWRLERDPTWYQGRGKARAVGVFGDVAKTVEGAGKIAAAVAGGSFLNGNHWRLARDPTWYQGRGKERAVGVFGDVAKTVEGAGNIASAVAGGSL